MTTIPGHWQEELRLLFGVALIASLAGVLTGKLLLCLLLGLLLYLVWHLLQLARLPRLLRQNKHRRPRPYGLWKDIVQHIEDIQHQQLSHSVHNRDLGYQLERFRDTVNSLPDAVIILQASAEVDWSNPAAKGLLGITWPEAQGRLLTALVPDPLLADYLAKAVFTTPLVINSPVNRAKILSIFITPLKQDVERFILVARDITRQYYLDVSRRDFVANISHELRTPLTVISGLAEQLNTAEPDLHTLPRSIELIREQAQRMNELVSDLLTLSRLESQHKSSQDTCVPVAELLSTIVDEARTLSGAAQHVLRLELGSTDNLRGDPKELRAAFSNLVTNAIKHTPQQAEVRIAWRVDNKGAHLSVTDTGEGIAARHIPRLTERLYRVDVSHSRDTGGTGLGLAIVKHALEHHQAELEIISSVGGGSSFICHFPPARVIPSTADKT